MKARLHITSHYTRGSVTTLQTLEPCIFHACEGALGRPLGHFLLASHDFMRCLRLKPLIRVSFWRALKFQPFNLRVGSNPRRQSKNLETKSKTHVKLVHEISGKCFQYNVKNKKSTTSCSDNALRLLVLWRVDSIEDFKWRPHCQFGVAFCEPNFWSLS